ncbi:MAG: YfbM family protein [Cyanobacteria bacterium J06648_16]
MASRGVLYALSDAELQRLLNLPSDEARIDYLFEEIEEALFDTDQCAETDKAWDGIHRALSDGSLSWEGGEAPLNAVILGGESLLSVDDCIFSLKLPQQVVAVDEALQNLSLTDFSSRYWQIDASDYGHELSDEDLEYAWDWLQPIRKLYRFAATKRLSILFTVDL